jgi:hypothetical protein
MSHQPYETYLFSGEMISADQQSSLAAHLLTCEQCAHLAQAMTRLDEAFSNSPAPSTPLGFTERFQTRLAAYRQKRQIRNLWLITICLFTFTSLIGLTIILLNLYHFNWSYELSQSIARVSLLAAQIKQFVTIIKSFINALPIAVPMLFLFGFVAVFGICTLLITWFSTMIRLYSPIHERGN